MNEPQIEALKAFSTTICRQRWNMTFNDWELKFGGPVVFYSIDNDEISPPKISRSSPRPCATAGTSRMAQTHGHGLTSQTLTTAS